MFKFKSALAQEIVSTVAGWHSMGRAISQTLGRAFSFLVNPQKFVQIFRNFDIGYIKIWVLYICN